MTNERTDGLSIEGAVEACPNQRESDLARQITSIRTILCRISNRIGDACTGKAVSIRVGSDSSVIKR